MNERDDSSPHFHCLCLFVFLFHRIVGEAPAKPASRTSFLRFFIAVWSLNESE